MMERAQKWKNIALALAGVIDPASNLIKFEKQLVISAEAEVQMPFYST